MKKRFFLSTIALMSLSMLAGCGGGGGGTSQTSSGGTSQTSQTSQTPSGDTDLNIGAVKVWCDEKVHARTEQQIKDFMALHPGYKMTYTIEEKSEAKAAGDMLLDPDAGADVYFFAQDQLARLLTGKAIAQVPNAYKSTVAEANDEASVGAATISGNLYAYPATSDNTFFLYYDNTVLSENDVKTFETIVAKSKAAQKKVYFNYGDVWYNSSFFFGAGCVSEWTMNASGKFVDYNDTFKSPAGKDVIDAMHNLFSDTTVAVNSSENSAFNKGAAALISGTWAKGDVQKALGTKMGVATLPTFTANNNTYPMKSFGGFKLVGVKPQQEQDRVKGIHQLAIYLTNQKSQLERFEENGWGPSNKAAQQNEKVAADPTLKVCFAQMKTSIPQGQFPGGWWTAGNLLGTEAVKETYDAAKILNVYDETLPTLING